MGHIALTANFNPDEERRIVAALARRETLACPRCSGHLDVQRIPPRRDVAYVRDRLWLVCGGCGRSALVDRRHLPP